MPQSEYLGWLSIGLMGLALTLIGLGLWQVSGC